MTPAKPNRYEDPTPYDVLGVKPNATAVELRERKVRLEEEIQISGGTSAERAKRQQQIEEAYDQISTGARRVRTDFFLVDPSLGRRQLQALAGSLPPPNLSVDDTLQPKRVTIDPGLILVDLRSERRDPARIDGLFPRPMAANAEHPFPEPLQVEFDC